MTLWFCSDPVSDFMVLFRFWKWLYVSVQILKVTLWFCSNSESDFMVLFRLCNFKSLCRNQGLVITFRWDLNFVPKQFCGFLNDTLYSFHISSARNVGIASTITNLIFYYLEWNWWKYVQGNIRVTLCDKNHLNF